LEKGRSRIGYYDLEVSYLFRFGIVPRETRRLFPDEIMEIDARLEAEKRIADENDKSGVKKDHAATARGVLAKVTGG